MRLLVRSCVAAALVSIGVALGVPSGAMGEDPTKRGPAFAADNKTVGKAGNFAYKKWPGQYFSFWTKFRGEKPKTAEDIRYFGFTAGAEQKVDLLRRKFPLETGRYKAVQVEFSWNHLWKASSQVGTYLDRKHPGLLDGTMSLFTGHNAFEMEFTRRAPKVKRYILKRWKGAIRIKQPSGRAAARVAAAATDNQVVREADEYARATWPREFAGIWPRARNVKPKTKKKIYFVGFTEGAASNVAVLQEEFPLTKGRYMAVKVKRSLDDLLVVMNGVNKFMRKKKVDLDDYSLSLETARNAIGISFDKPDPRIRRALKKRFGSGIVVIRGA